MGGSRGVRPAWLKSCSGTLGKSFSLRALAQLSASRARGLLSSRLTGRLDRQEAATGKAHSFEVPYIPGPVSSHCRITEPTGRASVLSRPLSPASACLSIDTH